jgi:hypothetical protein
MDLYHMGWEVVCVLSYLRKVPYGQGSALMRRWLLTGLVVLAWFAWVLMFGMFLLDPSGWGLVDVLLGLFLVFALPLVLAMWE